MAIVGSGPAGLGAAIYGKRAGLSVLVAEKEYMGTCLLYTSHVGDKNVDAAQEGQPVTIQLDREVDVSRGCVLSVDSGIKTAAAVTATILWMDDDALENGKNFFIKLGTKMIPGLVTKIVSLIDVNTGEKKEVSSLHKNEIAVCEIAFADRIVADTFAAHKTLGELILICLLYTSRCV